MIENDFAIFHLTASATIADVKKAYRKLAKSSHPDRFPEAADKARQEAVMRRINEAYRALVEYLQNNPAQSLTEPPPGEPEADYSIYKRGVIYFDSYYTKYAYYFKHFKETDSLSLKQKHENLMKARECFERLLRDYPDSDWGYDAEERLKKLAKIMSRLEEQIDQIDNHDLKWTKNGTPYWEKKE